MTVVEGSNANINRIPNSNHKKIDRLSSSQLKYSYNVCHTEDNQASREYRDFSPNYSTEKYIGTSKGSHKNLSTLNEKKVKKKPSKFEESGAIEGYADFKHDYLKTEVNPANNMNTSITNTSNYFNKKTMHNPIQKPFRFQLQSHKQNINNTHSNSIWVYPCNTSNSKSKNTATEPSIISYKNSSKNKQVTKGRDLEKIILSIRDQMKKKSKNILKPNKN